MTHLNIIEQIQGDGLSLSITDEGQIDVAGKPAIVNRWVPKLREHKPEIFAALSAATVTDMTQADELAIRGWLAYIDEDDPLVVEQVIHRCRVDPDARQYFLMRSREVPLTSDDRRCCTECCNYEGGYCQAAKRGEMPDVGTVYRPWVGLPRRCDHYQPVS